MLQVKVGIQLASLRQPFKKALHTAARLGADAVEIDARTELRPSELSQTGARSLQQMAWQPAWQVSCRDGANPITDDTCGNKALEILSKGTVDGGESLYMAERSGRNLSR